MAFSEQDLDHLAQTLPHEAGGPARIQTRHLQTHTINRPVVHDRRFHTTPSLPVRFPDDPLQTRDDARSPAYADVSSRLPPKPTGTKPKHFNTHVI